MSISEADSRELYLDLLKKSLTGWLYEESGWKFIVKAMLNGQVVQLPPDVSMIQKTPLDRAQRAQGRDWPLFAYSMVGLKRLDNIQWCIEEVLRAGVAGDLIETGVWRGGASIFMRGVLKAHHVTDRTVWVADSFEGMPTPGPEDRNIAPRQSDLSGVEYMRVSLEQVRENFKTFGLLDDQVRFIKGWFKQTLAGAPVQKLALLRLDGDLYDSTKDSLTALYRKVSRGGFVIVDDYYSWAGCRAAVDEFRGEHRITAALEKIDWTGAFWRVGA